MAKVEIRPLEQKKWHGKEGKENFSKPKVIEVLFDVETGGYATGLTKEEADKYGKLMGVDLSDTFVFEQPHPYFSTKAAQISLPNHTIILDDTKPVEFVKIKNLKASKFVANSMEEYSKGKWPFATHVIYDINEEVEIKAKKVELIEEATIKASEMSDDAKVSLIQVIRNKNLKGRTTNFIKVELSDIIQKEPDEFLKWVKMGKEEVSLRAQVLECLQKNILTKDGSAIYYLGDQIGHDLEAAITYLKQAENQKIKIAIFEKLNK